jgi:predicted nucleic acid-binding protein
VSDLYLVDTSMWTCTLRRSGDPASRQRVLGLMRTGKAAWCDAIRLELWRGVGSEQDRDILHRLQADIRSLPISDQTWESACRLADLGRRKGLQFPSQDLIIFSCANQHGAEIVTRDRHFEQLAKLWQSSAFH